MALKYNTKRVLVVDDDKNISEMIRDALELKGYEVAVANSGEKAVQEAFEFSPDIITLDLEMPLMSGFEVLSRLKNDSRTKDITVFILSVRDDAKSLKKGHIMGAKEYVVKPFSLTALEELIKEDLHEDSNQDDITLH